MVRHVRTIDQIKYCPLDQTHRHVYWAGRTLCRHSSLWSMSRYQSQRQLQWGAGSGGGRRRRWKSAPGAWGLAGSSALLHILPTPMVNYTHTSKQIPRHSSNESLFSCWAFGFWRDRNPTAELQRERSQGFTSVTSHTPLSQKKKKKQPTMCTNGSGLVTKATPHEFHHKLRCQSCLMKLHWCIYDSKGFLLFPIKS